jgi:hypothetical protein
VTATGYIVIGALAIVAGIVDAVLIEYRRDVKAMRRSSLVNSGGGQDQQMATSNACTSAWSRRSHAR